MKVLRRVLAGVALLLLAGTSRADIVRGVVLDEQGQPIFNADFNVYDPVTGNKLAASDKTDATGAYRLLLDPGVYDLLCRPVTNGVYAPRIRRGVVVSGTLNMDWVLPPAAELRGIVTDSRNPDPNTNGVYPVNFDYDRTDDGSRQPSLGNLTNLLGRFRTFIEAGSYTITANPDTASGLAPARVYGFSVPTANPTVDLLNFSLLPASYLNGFIRDTSGVPVPNAALKFDDGTGVRWPSYKQTSGPNGEFRDGVAPAVYRVTIEPPIESRYAALRVPGIDLTSSTTRDFVLTPGVLISGLITDKQGHPVDQCNWTAYGEDGLAVVTPGDKSGPDGRYRFVVARGTFRLRMVPPASSGLDSVVFTAVPVRGDTTINVDYAILGGGGGPGASPVVRFAPQGNPTHTRANLTLVLNQAVTSALVEVYDVSGRRVRVLHDGPLSAGTNPLAWDGRRDNGAQAHTGVFLVRARLDGHEQVTRFVLLP